MSVLVVGLSHRSAPVPLLERAAVAGSELDKLLSDVHSAVNVGEAMIVSTCNRIEVYAAVDKFHGGVSAICDLLARYSAVPLEELSRHLYVHYEDRAVQHVFAVTCGLDSMVIGETQILGQVRQAFRHAQQHGTVGRHLHEVVQHALRAGKRAHAETGIDQAGASLVGVGLRIAAERLGGLAGRRALVVGAGSMSALAVANLAREDVSGIVVANRTYERARHLASGVAEPAARAVRLAELDAELREADLVVACTGADGLVITAEQLAAARPPAAGRPLFLLDLALPHDVSPEVRELPGVVLANLEDLRTAQQAEQAVGPRAVEAVRAIVTEEVAAFLNAERAAAVAPTVVALRSKAAEVVDAELARLSGRLPELEDPRLNDKVRGEVARTVQRVVDKLLHAPTVRIKELAAAPGGDSYTSALRELFDLDPQAPEAVARADIDRADPRGDGRGPGGEPSGEPGGEPGGEPEGRRR